MYAYLLLSSDVFFPLEKVTEALGIWPTETWRQGEPVFPDRPYPTRLYSAWKYEMEMKKTLDSNDVLQPLLDIFGPKTDVIHRLKKEYNLDVQVELVIEIYNGRTPALGMETEFIKFASEISAGVDVDMYVYPFNEE